MKTLKRYYQDFKFKHPNPNDIKRTAERVTDATLDWSLTEWTQTTKTVDYGIKEVKSDGIDKTNVVLERIGKIPMPIDLTVEYSNGSVESFYIPLRLMSFEKENPYPEVKRSVLNDWTWSNPTYEFMISKPKSSIKRITIDSSELMADINRLNNVYELKIEEAVSN